jgi:hypothetical protein
MICDAVPLCELDNMMLKLEDIMIITVNKIQRDAPVTLWSFDT